MKKKPLTKADLQRKVKELEVQLAHQCFFAKVGLKKAGKQHCLGSAIILELTFLGGIKAVEPVAIRDGLSDETIAALQADLERSYNLAVEFKP